jgi:hypothetical protein
MKETDGGNDPGFPSVAEMKESQRKGAEGKGTSEKTYNEMMSEFDQGCKDCPL